MPTPQKHKRLWQYQIATEVSTASTGARNVPPTCQWKQRPLQCTSQEFTNHHVKVTNSIYCIHCFSSWSKKNPQTLYRRPLYISRKVKTMDWDVCKGTSCHPTERTRESHPGGGQHQFVPPGPQWVKTSWLKLSNTSQKIQTLGIWCLFQYPPHYRINHWGGGKWHTPNLLPGTAKPLIYLTAILLAQPLLYNGALFLTMRNYWAVCDNCFPVMFHFQTPSSVSLFPFNPEWLSAWIQMICSFL